MRPESTSPGRRAAPGSERIECTAPASGRPPSRSADGPSVSSERGLAAHLPARSPVRDHGTPAHAATLPPRGALPALGAGPRTEGATCLPARQSLSPEYTIEKAVRYLDLFSIAMKPLQMPQDKVQLRKLSSPAFEKATEAMGALSRLKLAQRRSANDFGYSTMIEQQRATAAYYMVLTTPLHVQGGRTMAHLLEEAAQADHEGQAVDVRRRSEFLLGKWAEYVAQENTEVIAAKRPYVAAMDDIVKRYGSVHALDTVIQADIVLENSVKGIAEARMGDLSVHMGRISLSLALLSVIDVHRNARDKIMETYRRYFDDEEEQLHSVVDLLQDPRVPVLPQEKAWLECRIQMLHRDIKDFFMAALYQMRVDEAMKESPSPLKKENLHETLLGYTAMQVGKAIRALTDCLHEAMQVPKLSQAVAQRIHGLTVLDQATDRPAPAVDLDVQTEEAKITDTQASYAAAGSANEAPQPSGRRKSQKARARQAWAREEAGGGSGAQALAAPSQPARAALTAKGEAVLELAQQRLKGFLPPAEPLAGGDDRLDILALGEALGKDTSAVRMALEQRIDPLSTANLMRSALTSWFGEPSLWKKQLGQLNDLQEPEHPLVAKAIAAFQERIAGIERLHGQLRQVESDLVKGCDYPMASHIAKLLELDAVQDLGRPRLLPSQGDPDGAHGTLFEVKVRLHACSDGREAAPLYLHLHTREATDAGACKTLAFEDLAAVHVKTAAQRSLGASWEALQASLQVEDAKVHRGSIPAALLATLQRRMPE